MRKSYWRASLLFAAATLAWTAATAPAATAARPRLGTVTGLVRDNKGQPLAGAIIRFVRAGADHVAKQTSTKEDGTFTARVLPGKYLLTAVAQGFNTVSFPEVQVNPSDEISYRFNLEPVGQGRTAPERRSDRNDPKWRLRSARTSRSIFHADGARDATAEAAETAVAQEANAAGAADAEESADLAWPELASPELSPELLSRGGGRPSVHGFFETYTAFSADPSAAPFAGTDFAFSTPASDDLDLIFAGQFATNGFARFETAGRLRLGDRHRLSASVAGATLPLAARAGDGAGGRSLSQISVRAIDEWIVRDGVVVVFGLDYSRFLRGGSAASLSPRLGLQFEADARTRVNFAYAPGGNSTRRQSAVNFEDGPVVFTESGGEPVAFVDGRAVLERSHRLEFGVERVIDNDSMVEASAFFDTVEGRGVGLTTLPLNSFGSGAGLLQVANQQGAARGLRVVYTRRVSRHLNAAAGYSFGRGQELTALAAESLPESPGDLFRSGFFQTAAAQVDSSFHTGTRVRTVLRFSPRAAVFAIDPFAGRVAVFDPSLSILVTQELPTFGLPVRAEAVMDARNLLDAQASADDGETVTTVNANRRMLRGGISVRF
jgi:Carboxypeptidase regulatory-like domain